jgi:hypothetical protein
MKKWTKKRWRNEIIALVCIVVLTAAATVSILDYLICNMI